MVQASLVPDDEDDDIQVDFSKKKTKKKKKKAPGGQKTQAQIEESQDSKKFNWN